MNKALPLILLAGGAILVMGGKKKETASEEGPFDEPPPPGSPVDLILTPTEVATKDLILVAEEADPQLILKVEKAFPAEKKKIIADGNKAVNEEAKEDKPVGGLDWRSGSVGDIQKNPTDGNYYIYWGKTKPLPPDQRKGKHADFSKRWRKRPKKKNVKKAVAAAVLSGGGAAAHDAYVQYLLFVYKRRNRYYSNWQ